MAQRRFSRFGLLLTLAILLAVVAFGLFKRRGARKPPPIPDAATGSLESRDRPSGVSGTSPR